MTRHVFLLWIFTDMACFDVHGSYHCRDMGNCSWQGDSGGRAFRPTIPQRKLTIHERKHVRFLTMTQTPGTLPSIWTETTDHRTRVA